MKTILAKIKTGSQTVRLAGQQNNNNHLGKSVFIRVHLWLKLNHSGFVGGHSDSEPVSGAETRRIDFDDHPEDSFRERLRRKIN
jgi:hypothetical protein